MIARRYRTDSPHHHTLASLRLSYSHTLTLSHSHIFAMQPTDTVTPRFKTTDFDLKRVIEAVSVDTDSAPVENEKPPHEFTLDDLTKALAGAKREVLDSPKPPEPTK
jgi:hypothetical protein